VPSPYEKPCKVVLGVKTALDGGIGQPRRLERQLEERSLSYSLGHSIAYSERIRWWEIPEGYGYKDIGFFKLFLYVLFEYLPKKLTFGVPGDYYGLLNPKACKPILSNMPALISTPVGEFPNYSFILGKRWNLAYPSCENMESFIPVVDGDVNLIVYSPPGLYPPSSINLKEGTLSVSTKRKQTLIKVFKDGKLWGVYDQSSLTLQLKESGSYEVRIYYYKTKIYNLYFGLRFGSCASGINIQAM